MLQLVAERSWVAANVLKAGHGRAAYSHHKQQPVPTLRWQQLGCCAVLEAGHAQALPALHIASWAA
jgi:hypothetical protein